MKKATITKFMMLCCLMVSTAMSYAQEWVVPVEGEWYFDFHDMIPVDGGESVLGIGCTRTEDGYIAKTGKDGGYSFREVHLPGMMLEYITAVQLDDGNYMAFGVCDDSLCDYRYQRHLRVDVFDGNLESVTSRTYDVAADSVFACFVDSRNGFCMRSIVAKTGEVVLAACPSYYMETNYGGMYQAAMRFYVFDQTGDIVRIVDNPPSLAHVGAIKEITYEPHSDNLLIVVKGGNYGNDTGSAGIFVADSGLDIVAHQSMLHLGGADVITDNACEGRWFDGDRLLVDGQRYVGSHFSYHTLYIVDSALHVYADLRLPPEDSCTWISYGTNTAYINDSTIFAFSCSSDDYFWGEVQQVNVMLVDKHLNLLGRKVLKKEDVICYASSPAAFNDGGCAVLVCSSNGQYYPGQPFRRFEMMKFRREDIEITWDVVKEPGAARASSAYPNPTRHRVNITTDGAFAPDARLQVFDARGVKCLDSAVGQSGGLITLDVQNLDAGLYLYKVVSGNRVFSSGKFIKE